MPRREMVIDLFKEGLACSKIDRILGLAPGTSRECVVSWWFRDKMTPGVANATRTQRKGTYDDHVS